MDILKTVESGKGDAEIGEKRKKIQYWHHLLGRGEIFFEFQVLPEALILKVKSNWYQLKGFAFSGSFTTHSSTVTMFIILCVYLFDPKTDQDKASFPDSTVCLLVDFPDRQGTWIIVYFMVC